MGSLGLAVLATMEPGGWLRPGLRAAGFHDVVAAGTAVVFGGGIGLAILVMQPFFGLIYRFDRPVFHQMMAPSYRAPRSLRQHPPPPLDKPLLHRYARVALGLGAAAALGLLAAGGLRWLGADGPAWAGLALGLGGWLAVAVLVGGRLYLWLRDTAPPDPR